MAIQQHASEIFNQIQHATDKVIKPDSRQRFFDRVKCFSQNKPFLFSFLLVHLLLSAAPILLFLGFAISVTLFSLSIAAIISLFWVFGALVVLIGFLFLSGFIATSIWVSGVGGIIATKWGHKVLFGKKQLEITIRESEGTQINGRQNREKKENAADEKVS